LFDYYFYLEKEYEFKRLESAKVKKERIQSELKDFKPAE